MAWLRIDDGFAFHPKIGALTRGERWTWMEVLCHCATQRTGGTIPSNITEVYRHVTPGLLDKLEEIGLVDRDDENGLNIHDWAVYNQAQETAAERQKRYRERHRNGTRDVTEDVTRDVASDVTRDVTRDVPSRAGTRARPQPQPQEQPSFHPELQDAEGRKADQMTTTITGEAQALLARFQEAADDDLRLD